MTAVLHRFRILIAILTLLLATAIVLFVLFRQNNDKIPSRGVFVMGDTSRASDGLKMAYKTFDNV